MGTDKGMILSGWERLDRQQRGIGNGGMQGFPVGQGRLAVSHRGNAKVKGPEPCICCNHGCRFYSNTFSRHHLARGTQNPLGFDNSDWPLQGGYEWEDWWGIATARWFGPQNGPDISHSYSDDPQIDQWVKFEGSGYVVLSNEQPMSQSELFDGSSNGQPGQIITKIHVVDFDGPAGVYLGGWYQPPAYQTRYWFGGYHIDLASGEVRVFDVGVLNDWRVLETLTGIPDPPFNLEIRMGSLLNPGFSGMASVLIDGAEIYRAAGYPAFFLSSDIDDPVYPGWGLFSGIVRPVGPVSFPPPPSPSITISSWESFYGRSPASASNDGTVTAWNHEYCPKDTGGMEPDAETQFEAERTTRVWPHAGFRDEGNAVNSDIGYPSHEIQVKFSGTIWPKLNGLGYQTVWGKPRLNISSPWDSLGRPFGDPLGRWEDIPYYQYSSTPLANQAFGDGLTGFLVTNFAGSVFEMRINSIRFYESWAVQNPDDPTANPPGFLGPAVGACFLVWMVVTWDRISGSGGSTPRGGLYLFRQAENINLPARSSAPYLVDTPFVNPFFNPSGSIDGYSQDLFRGRPGETAQYLPDWTGAIIINWPAGGSPPGDFGDDFGPDFE